MFSADDHQHMARALRLAAKGMYTTQPNPRVGAVIVRDGLVVGEGFHARAGEAHAEVHALRAAGSRAIGATAYVTLEPCAHQGRTPPCVDALIVAKLARVVVAIDDPFPRVAGAGIKRLREAGIRVDVGLMANEARALNIGFINRFGRGFGFVRLKLGISLDGRTALASGESKWITGDAARADVQHLRARSSAIVTGADTVIADDPHLSVRLSQAHTQPTKVILDRHLRTPASARLFDQHNGVLIYNHTSKTRPDLIARGADLIEVSPTDSAAQLKEVLIDLSHRGANEILIESGPTLAGAFLAAGLIDEIWLYLAPKFLGDSARPLAALNVESLAQAPQFNLIDVRAFGPDLRLIYSPSPAPSEPSAA